MFLPRVRRDELNGSEPLRGVGEKTVLDYWRWAHSDVLENVQRGIYAEFLVAAALGITCMARDGWAGYDLLYDDYKIEVKSSAYLQAWAQTRLSRISFGIGAKIQFNPEGPTETDPRRVADCFVFCVFADTDPMKAEILNATRWHFYVVPITRLIEFCRTAKSVGEKRVQQITDHVSYDALKDRIDATRAGTLFQGSLQDALPTSYPAKDRVKTYAVWERGTRLHPVIVRSANANNAYVLARADPTIASFSTSVAASVVSEEQLLTLLRHGAVDLR